MGRRLILGQTHPLLLSEIESGERRGDGVELGAVAKALRRALGGEGGDRSRQRTRTRRQSSSEHMNAKVYFASSIDSQSDDR